MTAAAHPFACCKPALIASQPINRPRDDGMGDWFPGMPFPSGRVIETQKGPFRTIPVLVVMWDGLFRLFSSSAQRRVNHCYVRKLWTFGTAFFAFSVESDLNRVHLAQGSKPSLPSHQATRPTDHPEIWPPLPHEFNLFTNRQTHCPCRSSPKKVCFGVASAPDGMARLSPLLPE